MQRTCCVPYPAGLFLKLRFQEYSMYNFTQCLCDGLQNSAFVEGICRPFVHPLILALALSLKILCYGLKYVLSNLANERNNIQDHL